MILNVFAVQDMKAGAFHPPFVADNKDVACRLLSDMVAREGHPYNLHPEDYMVYWIGSFDQTSGVVTGGLVLEPLVGLVNLKG